MQIIKEDFEILNLEILWAEHTLDEWWYVQMRLKTSPKIIFKSGKVWNCGIWWTVPNYRQSENWEKLRTFSKKLSCAARFELLVAADRDGNVTVVEELMPVFLEFDSINCLRNASWYLERIKALESENPIYMKKLCEDTFWLKINKEN